MKILVFLLTLVLSYNSFAADTWFGSSPTLLGAVDTDPVGTAPNSVWFRHVPGMKVRTLGYNKAVFPSSTTAFVEISQDWSRTYTISQVDFINDGTTPMTAPGEGQPDSSAHVFVHYDASTVTYDDLVTTLNTVVGFPQAFRLNYPEPAHEVQKISFSTVPASGYFWLQSGATYTDAIPYDATASDVQTELRAATGDSGLTVEGSFNQGFTATFSTSANEPALTYTTELGESTAASVLGGYIIFTAAAAGTAGNSLYAEGIPGGTAGSEIVTIVADYPTAGKTTIRVQGEEGVSTVGQVMDALEASTDAMALVTVSVATEDRENAYPAFSAGPNQLAGGTGSGLVQAGLADSEEEAVTATVTEVTKGSPDYTDESTNQTAQEFGSTLSVTVGPQNANEAYKFKVQGDDNVFELSLSIVGSRPVWAYPDYHSVGGT